MPCLLNSSSNHHWELDTRERDDEDQNLFKFFPKYHSLSLNSCIKLLPEIEHWSFQNAFRFRFGFGELSFLVYVILRWHKVRIWIWNWCVATHILFCHILFKFGFFLWQINNNSIILYFISYINKDNNARGKRLKHAQIWIFIGPWPQCVFHWLMSRTTLTHYKSIEKRKPNFCFFLKGKPDLCLNECGRETRNNPVTGLLCNLASFILLSL